VHVLTSRLLLGPRHTHTCTRHIHTFSWPLSAGEPNLALCHRLDFLLSSTCSEKNNCSRLLPTDDRTPFFDPPNSAKSLKKITNTNHIRLILDANKWSPNFYERPHRHLVIPHLGERIRPTLTPFNARFLRSTCVSSQAASRSVQPFFMYSTELTRVRGTQHTQTHRPRYV